MFLNRKLIVQLSTSRFRPQPKEVPTSIPQAPKQLMMMDAPSYHHLTNGGSTTLNQQQPSTSLTPQYTYPEVNYDMMTLNGHHQHSSSPIPDNNNSFFPNTYRSSSPLSQDINNYYSMPIDRSLNINPMKTTKTGNSNRMDLFA
jgi:hypothetical protein